MGMTISQKILAAHAGREMVEPGELLNCRLDVVLGNDVTAPVAIAEFKRLELDKVFDILTAEIKKEYPDLEPFLKDIYLNKWYNSQLPTLHGMSPCEAYQTEEGTRLLWAMFKKIKDRNGKRCGPGPIAGIQLKEYIRKLEQKKHKNI
jgi:hypothetical protein